MESYFCWGWDQHPFTSHVAWFNGPNESLKVQKVSQYFFSSVFPRVPWGATIVTFNFIQGKLREFFISFKKKVSKLKQILSKKTNRLWRERQTQINPNAYASDIFRLHKKNWRTCHEFTSVIVLKRSIDLIDIYKFNETSIFEHLSSLVW